MATYLISREIKSGKSKDTAKAYIDLSSVPQMLLMPVQEVHTMHSKLLCRIYCTPNCIVDASTHQ